MGWRRARSRVPFDAKHAVCRCTTCFETSPFRLAEDAVDAATLFQRMDSATSARGGGKTASKTRMSAVTFYRRQLAKPLRSGIDGSKRSAACAGKSESPVHAVALTNIPGPRQAHNGASSRPPQSGTPTQFRMPPARPWRRSHRFWRSPPAPLRAIASAMRVESYRDQCLARLGQLAVAQILIGRLHAESEVLRREVRRIMERRDGVGGRPAAVADAGLIEVASAARGPRYRALLAF